MSRRKSTDLLKRLRYFTLEQSRTIKHGILRDDDEVSFLPMESIGEQGELDLSATRRVDDVSSGYTPITDGDVIVPKITPCFENGKGALVNGLIGGVGFATTELHVLTPGPDLDGRFLYYITVDPRFRKQGEAHMFGAAGQQRVPAEFVRDYRVAVPPLSQQRTIVRYLDQETARLDLLVAQNRKLLDVLRERREALITTSVLRGLNPAVSFRDSGVPWIGDVPAHWEIWKLGHLASVGNGSTPNRGRREYWENGDTPWLNSSVANQEEVTGADQFVTWLAVRDCHLPLVTRGSVIVAITGQGKTRGRAAVLSMNSTINQHLAFVSADSCRLTSWYLKWTLSAAYDYLRNISDDIGGTKGALTCEHLVNLRVPVPPKAEQQEIVTEIASSTRAIDDLSKEAERTVALLKERRASLTSAAIAGAIDLEGGP